jgi:acetamidase/formamidase
MSTREHTIQPGVVHHVWDSSLPPVLTVRPGDVVRCSVREGSAGQIWPGAPASRLQELDLAACYPLAGPIEVEGAEAGDVLAIDILEMRPSEWGWAGITPGFGLLGDDFDEPTIRYFDLRDGERTTLCDGVSVPLQPFLGTMGVALDEPGALPVLPPTKGAGNVDTRHLTVGSRLFLPVYVPGGLLSVGDAHAAQGDGEVCGTAIECGMDVALRIDVVHDGVPVQPWTYRFTTPPGSPQPGSDTAGYVCVTALDPDLMEAARTAVRELIAWITATHGLSREDAYILCSLAADLRISQIVDKPTFGVTAHLSLAVFE